MSLPAGQGDVRPGQGAVHGICFAYFKPGCGISRKRIQSKEKNFSDRAFPLKKDSAQKVYAGGKPLKGGIYVTESKN